MNAHEKIQERHLLRQACELAELHKVDLAHSYVCAV